MNNQFKIIILLLMFVLLSSLMAQNYLWPTNSSTLMSSSFCEFRDGHYHSAIDIKTWLREGYPCYAIADGYVERVRVSPFGYGKVLYLKLDDGNKAVYAHLQRFDPQIEKKVRQIQMKNQKYRVDWFPVNWRVKKGDIIAYTGSTGTGLPHLHFEIRSKRNRPLNPLAFYSQIKDNIRPRLDKIAVIPLQYDSRINGNALPQVFQLTYIRDGIYIVKKPLRIQGEVGLAIKGYDQADGAANKYGFYNTTLEIEGELIFQITYDELNFAQTNHIYTETYYPFWADSHQVFHKLYIEPHNPLSFYNRIPPHDGTLTLKDSPKQFSITIQDFHGNKSIIRGELVPDDRSSIRIANHYFTDNYLYLDFYSPPLKELQFYHGSDLNNMQQISYYELLEGIQGNPESIIKSKILLPDSLQNYVQLVAKTHNNQTINKTLVTNNDSTIAGRILFLDKRLIIETKNYYAGSYLQLDPVNQKFPFYETEDGNAQVVLPSVYFSQPLARISIFANDQSVWSSHTPARIITPYADNRISWFDSTLTLSVPTGAILDTFLISAAKYQSDSLSTILPVASPVYEVLPGNIPFFRPFSINIAADSLPAWGKWHVYQTDGIHSVSFMSGLIDTTRISIETTSRSFGKYVVAADTISPHINIQAPVSGGQYSANPEIRIDVDDEFSGIGHEENIIVLIDGNFVLPEWDHEVKFVHAIIDKPLDRGVHTLSVSVSDQAGNISRHAVIFEIK